jgi:hypothetical protein
MSASQQKAFRTYRMNYFGLRSAEKAVCEIKNGFAETILQEFT